MPRPGDRVQTCTKADAVVRLGHARLYLEVATTVIGVEGDEDATVATGNAVLAAIAAADAICCSSTGSRYRGQDHARAAEVLEKATGDSGWPRCSVTWSP